MSGTYGTLKRVTWKDRPAWRLDAQAHVMVAARRIFPKVQGVRGGAAMMVANLDTARDLEWLLMRYPLLMSTEDRAFLQAEADRHRQREANVQAILSGGVAASDRLVHPAREPRRYQLQAADLALVNGHLILADALGLGKSFSALLALRDPEALPALIVTLTDLTHQWLRELQVSFPGFVGHILRTKNPYDIAKRREHKGYMPHVLICNYAKVAGWGETLAGTVRTLILDECQEVRIPDSQKYVALSTIADQADVVMGLSATPVYNYGPEIHSVADCIKRDSLGSLEEFNREWTVINDSGKRVVKDPRALGSHLRSEGLMVRRTRVDVAMELPDEPQRIPWTIGSDEKVVEGEMDRVAALAEMVYERSGSKEDVFKASGQLDWRLRRATGLAKAPYVADFVRMILEAEEPLPDGRPSKAILWGWHHDVYESWGERLEDLGIAWFTGRETAGAKRHAKTAFTEGDARLLIMSLRAGAGIDGLQKVCRLGVFGELDWSPGIHDQCIGRLDRDDGLGGVLAYFLVSESGSDPIVADVLNVKRAQADAIRDPDADLFGVSDIDASGHVRRLAEEVLRRRKRTPTAV